MENFIFCAVVLTELEVLKNKVKPNVKDLKHEDITKKKRRFIKFK